jgi:Cu+-exporting ATPase
MAGTGRAAREGIFIRNAEALETACKIDVLIMDKTGTITEGRPVVTDFLNISKMKDDKVIQFAASAEYYSEHHLGNAVVDYARSKDIRIVEASGFKSFIGKGIKAVVNKKEVVAGNAVLFKNQKIPLGGLLKEASRLSEQGKTPVFIGVDNKAVGLLAISDSPRKTSSDAIKKLGSMGIETIMVTGDNPRTAGYIAEMVGIEHVIAHAVPEQKVKIIKSLREKGRVVGMIGDGINDAPALATADVGFAIGTGTDIAIETAQVTLVGGDISKVLDAISLSRKTMTIIKQNLFWAFAYNTLSIPLAAFGALSPTIAAGAMALSSVSVVTNSLRLQKYKSDI